MSFRYLCYRHVAPKAKSGFLLDCVMQDRANGATCWNSKEKKDKRNLILLHAMNDTMVSIRIPVTIIIEFLCVILRVYASWSPQSSLTLVWTHSQKLSHLHKGLRNGSSSIHCDAKCLAHHKCVLSHETSIPVTQIVKSIGWKTITCTWWLLDYCYPCADWEVYRVQKSWMPLRGVKFYVSKMTI